MIGTVFLNDPVFFPDPRQFLLQVAYPHKKVTLLKAARQVERQLPNFIDHFNTLIIILVTADARTCDIPLKIDNKSMNNTI